MGRASPIFLLFYDTICIHRLEITFCGNIFDDVSYALCQQHPSSNNICKLVFLHLLPQLSWFLDYCMLSFFFWKGLWIPFPREFMKMPEDLVQDWHFWFWEKKRIADIWGELWYVINTTGLLSPLSAVLDYWILCCQEEIRVWQLHTWIPKSDCLSSNPDYHWLCGFGPIIYPLYSPVSNCNRNYI